MNEALTFLGLLYSGNQLIIGLDVENGIRKKKIKALLFTEDISVTSRKTIESLLGEIPLPMITCFSKEILGKSIGKGPITIVGFKSIKAYYSFKTKIERS